MLPLDHQGRTDSAEEQISMHDILLNLKLCEDYEHIMIHICSVLHICMQNIQCNFHQHCRSELQLMFPSVLQHECENTFTHKLWWASGKAITTSCSSKGNLWISSYIPDEDIPDPINIDSLQMLHI